MGDLSRVLKNLGACFNQSQSSLLQLSAVRSQQWGVYPNSSRRNSPNIPCLCDIGVLVLIPPLICLAHISSGIHQGCLRAGCSGDGLVAVGALAGARWHLLTEARSVQGLGSRAGGKDRLPDGVWSLHPSRYGKPDWTWSWTACSGCSCLSRGLDHMASGGSYQLQPFVCMQRMERRRGRTWLPAAKEPRKAKHCQRGASHLWTNEHLTCTASQGQNSVTTGWCADVHPGPCSSVTAEPPCLLSTSGSPPRHLCYSPVPFTPCLTTGYLSCRSHALLSGTAGQRHLPQALGSQCLHGLIQHPCEIRKVLLYFTHNGWHTDCLSSIQCYKDHVFPLAPRSLSPLDSQHSASSALCCLETNLCHVRSTKDKPFSIPSNKIIHHSHLQILIPSRPCPSTRISGTIYHPVQAERQDLALNEQNAPSSISTTTQRQLLGTITSVIPRGSCAPVCTIIWCAFVSKPVPHTQENSFASSHCTNLGLIIPGGFPIIPLLISCGCFHFKREEERF